MAQKEWTIIELTPMDDCNNETSDIDLVVYYEGYAIEGGKRLTVQEHPNKQYIKLWSGSRLYQLKKNKGNDYFEIIAKGVRICVRIDELKCNVYYR